MKFKRFFIFVLVFVAFYSCKLNEDFSSKNNTGCSLVINQNGTIIESENVNNSSRNLTFPETSPAQVFVIGSDFDPISKNVTLKNGKLENVFITNIPEGVNRVVYITTELNGIKLEISNVTDIVKGNNSVKVDWISSRIGGVYKNLILAKKDVSAINKEQIKTALTACSVGGTHASCIDFEKVASVVTGGTALSADLSAKVTFKTNIAKTSAQVYISDPASSVLVGVTGADQTIIVTPGTWTFKIKFGSALYGEQTFSVSSGETFTIPDVTLPDDADISEKSCVMLQGFTWASAPRGTGYNVENPNPIWGTWYGIVTGRSDDIKTKFDYLWCPPSSKCDSASSEGYAPTELNDLNNFYGTETELKEMINSIKPAKAIADIVVNHRAGSTCWGDFTNPDWGVVKGSSYTAICSDDEGFDSTKGDKDHMIGKPSGAADTGAAYEAYRDLDHTNTTVQQGIVDWMNNVLKPAGFSGWRYDYVKGFGSEYVGKYNQGSSAEFSVGEYWPSVSYDSSNPSAWGNEIKNWISGTSSGGQKSRAFDFALKGAMNTVFGCTWIDVSGNKGGATGSNNYSLLADSSNLMISQGADAVTFVDNHDTGSTQGHWALNTDKIPLAYALILTHPGVPCVAWNHYFTFSESGSKESTYPYSGISASSTFYASNTVLGTSKSLREHIDYLIELRKRLGIEYDSVIDTTGTTSSCYVSKITGLNGELLVQIGSVSAPTETGYSGNNPIYCGTNFAIWEKGVNGTGEIVIPETLTIKATSSSDWIDDAGAILYAWAWGGSAGEGIWINATADTAGNTTFTAPNDITNFKLVRFKPTGFTTPSFDNGLIWNQTSNVTIVSGTTEYSVSW